MASPPELGGGTVLMAHGELNVPAPAVAVLLRGLPTAPLDPTPARAGELVTPTGAALLAHYVQTFGPMPEGAVVAAGVGAGTREVADRPNVLRAFLIEPAPQEAAMQPDTSDGGRTAPEGGAVRHTATGIAGGVRRAQGEPQPPAEATGPQTAAPDEQVEPTAEPPQRNAEPSEPPEPAAQPGPPEPDGLTDYRAAESASARPPPPRPPPRRPNPPRPRRPTRCPPKTMVPWITWCSKPTSTTCRPSCWPTPRTCCARPALWMCG